MSTKYIHKQVWGEQIFTRTQCRRFDLVETGIAQASSIVFYDSTHTQHVIGNHLFTHGCRSNLSCGAEIEATDV